MLARPEIQGVLELPEGQHHLLGLSAAKDYLLQAQGVAGPEEVAAIEPGLGGTPFARSRFRH